MRLLSEFKSGLVRHWPAEREVLLCIAAALIYFGIRGLTVGSLGAALTNAGRLMRFEEMAHIAWEEPLQALIIGHIIILTLVNWVYIWCHWPVIISAAILLFRYRPSQYRLLRNAIFISGGIGFLFFALFPVAPPRIADPELVDTVTLYSQSYRAFQPPGLTNQFAAFPSLHFGWNVLVSIAVWQATTNIVLRWGTVLLSLAMAAAVVLTANHYVIDVVAGLGVVLVGLAFHELHASRTAARDKLAEKRPLWYTQNDGNSDSPPRRERPGKTP